MDLGSGDIRGPYRRRRTQEAGKTRSKAMRRERSSLRCARPQQWSSRITLPENPELIPNGELVNYELPPRILCTGGLRVLPYR